MKHLFEAIMIIIFLIIVIMCYFSSAVSNTVSTYSPDRPILVVDTTGMWPEPDSMFTFDNNLCVGYTYKQ